MGFVITGLIWAVNYHLLAITGCSVKSNSLYPSFIEFFIFVIQDILLSLSKLASPLILGGTSGRVAKCSDARRRSDGRQRSNLGRTLRRKREKLVSHRHGAGDKVNWRSCVRQYITTGSENLFLKG